MSSTRPFLVALLLAAASADVQAQSGPGVLSGLNDGRDWILGLSVLRDEDAYEHASASFHLGLSDSTWLSLAAGTSRAPSTETEVRASLFAAGIEHDFGPLGIAFIVEDWGDRNNLESRDVRGELFLSRDRFRVALTAERRDIDIFFSGLGQPIATDLRRAPIEADGLGLRWRVRLSPLWQTYGTWTDYDYPRRVRLVPRAERLDLLSSSTITLAYGFVDEYTTVGLERAVGAKLVSLDYGTDHGTIGGDRLRSLSASILWPVGRRLDLEFMLGSSRSSGLSSTTYGGLTLLIYGGG